MKRKATHAPRLQKTRANLMPELDWLLAVVIGLAIWIAYLLEALPLQ